MSSYQVEMTKSGFVWAAPPLRTGAIIKNRKETVLEVQGLNPARVKARRGANIYFKYLKYWSTCMSHCNLMCIGLGGYRPVLIDAPQFESTEV